MSIHPPDDPGMWCEECGMALAIVVVEVDGTDEDVCAECAAYLVHHSVPRDERSLVEIQRDNEAWIHAQDDQ